MKHDFFETFATAEEYNENHGKLSIDIQQCDEDKPPRRVNGNVKEFCEVTVDLGVRFKDLEDHFTESGRCLKRLDYEVEMVPSGASIDFSVYHGGVKLGSQQASIEFR